MKPMLAPQFLEALDELASSDGENWWKDILGHKDLVLAVRRNSLNAYHRGASIFRIDWKASKIIPTVHVKYLIRPNQSYVSLQGGQFTHSGVAPVFSSYGGLKTLNSMIKAAQLHVGPEKAGLHPMLVGNNNVIDSEIALARMDGSPTALDDDEAEDSKRKQDRIDAAVVTSKDGRPTIRFYEAKHFSNAGLRSAIGKPGVLEQIRDYESALTQHSENLSQRYLQTAKALVRLSEMRSVASGKVDGRQPHSLVKQIAQSGEPPAIDPNPHLIIYGFDEAQRDGAAWTKHLESLRQHLPERLRLIGAPTLKTKFAGSPSIHSEGQASVN
ncbi:hypothetical protein [Aliirhizobium smilacinae]|uniref:Uncharacterized protein n=1 Tax=Aliirhizobium smilacinae TaxID=1395944 RepID=A0A5C4X8Z9_9HYPH|nr:hypothetical protein [Rhizobium smilacinae]TNM59858.1 hypothetical protein FHP24_27175 [Rhizobium smilacinae]